MVRENKAKELLKWYFGLLARQCGVLWDDENDAEVDRIVDAIIKAAVRECKEACEEK